MFLPGREFDLQVDSLQDNRVGSAIEELESDQQDWVCVEFVFSDETGIDKSVG